MLILIASAFSFRDNMSSLRSFEKEDGNGYKSTSNSDVTTSIRITDGTLNIEQLGIEKTVSCTPVCSAADLESEITGDGRPSQKRSYLPFPEDTESMEADIAREALSATSSEMGFCHENVQTQKTDIFDSESRSAPESRSATEQGAVTEMGYCRSSSSLHIPGVSTLAISHGVEGQREGDAVTNSGAIALTIDLNVEYDADDGPQHAVTLMGDIGYCGDPETAETESSVMTAHSDPDGEAVTLMGHIDGDQKVKFVEKTKKEED